MRFTDERQVFANDYCETVQRLQDRNIHCITWDEDHGTRASTCDFVPFNLDNPNLATGE